MAIRRTGSQTLVNRGVTAAAATPVNIITGSGGGGATVNISSIQIANSTFVAKDDLAIDTAGGYMIINGTGFQSGAVVYIQGTAATSTSFVSSSRLNVTVPALSSGVLDVYVVNTDGSGSIYLQSLRANGVPSWTTTSPLTSQDSGTAFAINLVATGAAGDGTITYAVSSGSTLPSGTFLASNGYFYGTVSGIEAETTYSFSVDAIDAQNQETARSFNITITTGDAYFKNTVLLLNGETSNNTWITDASSNAFAITVNGDTRPVAFSPYETVWSNYFDGTGDYLSVADNAALNPGTSDFVMESWVYITGLTGANQGINGKGTAGTDGYSFYVTNGLVLSFIWNGTGGTTITGGTLSLNTWNHVAVVRNNGVIRLYLNGVGAGSSTACTTDITSTATKFVGLARGGNPILGYMSNYRMIKGTRPSGYDATTSSLTVPTSPLTAITNTSLLTCQSNRLIDNSTNNFTITRNGDVSVSNFGPFAETDLITGSAYFDGTGDYLTVPDNNSLDLSNDFTIECWVYYNSVSGTQVVVDKGWNNSTIAPYLIFSSGTSLVAYASSTGSNWDVLTGTSIGTISAKRWHHIAVTRSGSSIRTFLDGVLGNTVTNSSALFNSSSALGIGGGPSAGANPLNGYVSNLRIVKGTAVYTSSFTPPTSPLTAIANTSLLTLQSRFGENNSRFVDNSGINNIITRNGNATQGTFSPYQRGGWSGYFTGSSTSYIQTDTTTLLNQGQTYTVQCWIYPTSFTTSTSAVRRTYIFVKGVIYAGLSIHSDGTLGWYGWPTPGGMIATSSSGTITTNSWQHVAITVNPSGRIKLFKNGTEVANVAYTAAGADGSAITIGHGDTGQSTDGFIGHISNFKISRTELTGAQLDYSSTPLPSNITTSNTQLLTLSTNKFEDLTINRTITSQSAVTIQPFSPFKKHSYTPSSYSVNFPGSSSYISATYSANTAAWYDADYTMEMWVYPITIAASGTNGAPLQVGHGDATTSTLYWSFGYNSSGTPGLYYYNGNSQNFTASGTVTANAWNHIALTHRNSDGQMKMYLNGVDVGTATKSGTPQSSASFPINIGVAQGTYFNGRISNLRLVKGSIVYTGNFAVPNLGPLQISGTLSTGAYSNTTNINTTFANTSTSLLTCRDVEIIDNSIANTGGTPFNITKVGSVKPLSFNPSGFAATTLTTDASYSLSNEGGSVYFDGTGDYLNWSNSLFTFGTGDFTVEAWIYPMGDFGVFGVGPASAGSYGFYYSGSSLTFQSTRYGDSAGAGSTTNTYAKNQWMHVAAVRSSGTAKIYINGVADSGATYSMGSITNSGAYTGAIWNSASATGYITGLKISSRALYTSDFLVSNTPATTSNATFLLSGTNGSIIDYTGKNNLETVGDVKIRNNIVKYGNTSMYFDGTGDWMKTTLKGGLGSGDFTIEGWFYFTSLYDFVTTVSTTRGSTGFNIGTDAAGIIVWYSGGARQIASSSGQIVANTWYHIAYVRSGTTLTAYKNGTSVGSATVSTNFTAEALSIGALDASSEAMTGYIDDLRITKGVARYTSNFTTPTKQLQTN